MAALPPTTCAKCKQRKPCNCEAQRKREVDARRGSASERGYTWRWAKYSKAYLAQHPLCEIYCKRDGKITASECVDHIKPHRGDMVLFWDPTNHQAACLKCNTRKAIESEGGFGR